MCYFLNAIYALGSVIYYKLKVCFDKVEVLGVEMEIVAPEIKIEKFEIIGSIILWTEDLEVFYTSLNLILAVPNPTHRPETLCVTQ